MKNNLIKITFVLSLFSLIFTACDSTDDYTGRSTLNIGDPATMTIDIPAGTSITLIEDDSEFPFTLTVSEAKPYVTFVTLEQIAGTATRDLDYEMPSSLAIPAFATSVTGAIKILADDLIEDVETLTIQIGATANNVSYSPLNVQFEIANATSDDLVIGLNWAASEYTTDNAGEEISATDMADMRLLVTNSPYTGIYGGADGGSFETYNMSGAVYPDGEYLIVADFWDQFTAPVVRDIDINVTFDQIGVINGVSYDFPAAINNGATCAANYVVLAKVIKTGGNYDITPIGERSGVDVEGDWTLEMTDDWGDGWNGGYLTVTIDGTPTNYAAQNTGGGGVPGTTTEMFTVPAGSTLQISYTSGGGTGGSPGWESENTYVITAPDGTVYADGPVPTEGTIIDSENVCP